MANIINYKERRPVWNGLGTDISHCTTVDEALYDSGLDCSTVPLRSRSATSALSHSESSKQLRDTQS